MASSAFASSGPRLFEKNAAPEAPDAGSYDVSQHTMASQANRQKKAVGSFGTGRDTSGWLSGAAAQNSTPRNSSPRGRTTGIARSDETSKVYSSFGGTPSKSRAASTMGGGARFAPTKTATAAGPGDYYTPPALGANKSSNFNKSSNGTMGTSKRFGPVKEAVQGDYSDARPGAFERSKSTSGARANTGFGGTAARVTGPQVIEKSSTNLSYDGAYASTGAFAKATQAGTTSAAFASKSVQRTTMAAKDGPAPGAYNAYGSATSTFSSKSFNKSMASGTGGFGTSVRRTMDMGKPPPEDVPGPGEYAPDISDSTPRAARPSAAFASTTSKMAPLRTTSGPSADADYGDARSADGLAARATKTFNKGPASVFMGNASRFTPAPDPAPGPGEYRSQDSSFSKSKSGKQNAGFGGTAARVTMAEEAERAAEKKGSTNLSYDGAYATTGAFAKATQAGTTSAAFASKSEQRTTMAAKDGPAPGAYNVHAAAESGFSSKSFNKSMASGTGGFGTSAKRTMDMGKPAAEDVPGPGMYAPDISDGGGHATESRPSAAFASSTSKSVEVRNADAPSCFDYESHAHDGMAAVATKSFNRHVGTGSFGSKAARPMHEKKEVLPGAGEYNAVHPSKATVEATVKAGKGKVSGAFASTTLRDTTNWAMSGSKFLP